MSAEGFIHSDVEADSTVQRLKSLYDRVGPTEMLSCFAYATNSGAACFDMQLGAALWAEIETKWLFGIDYGRVVMELDAAVARAYGWPGDINDDTAMQHLLELNTLGHSLSRGRE